MILTKVNGYEVFFTISLEEIRDRNIVLDKHLSPQCMQPLITEALDRVMAELPSWGYGDALLLGAHMSDVNSFTLTITNMTKKEKLIRKKRQAQKKKDMLKKYPFIICKFKELDNVINVCYN